MIPLKITNKKENREEIRKVEEYLLEESILQVIEQKVKSLSRSVVSESLQPHGL